jgi:DNA-binding protein H-NS
MTALCVRRYRSTRHEKTEGEMVKVKISGQSVTSMPIDVLIKMRNEIDEELHARLARTRQQLAELERTMQQRNPAAENQQNTRRKPGAKYIGPNGETWTGRGLRPRWLQALIKQGHKIDEFAVEGTRQGAQPGSPRSKRAN